MLALAFFNWWYSRGWRQFGRRSLALTSSVGQAFSVSLLLRTLFDPWRRIVTHPGAGLANHFHAAIDNLVSRLVGFFVRLAVLIAAALSATIIAILGIILTAIWPLLPLAALATLVMGFIR